MWATLGRLFLTYLIYPLCKYTIGWAWALYQLKKENTELKKKNEELEKKFKEATGENALNNFGNLG